MAVGVRKQEEEDAVVEEFRAWLDAHKSPAWENLERHRTTMIERARASRDWESMLGRDGWLGLTWPEEYGGRGLSMRGAALIHRELARAGAPELFNVVALDLAAPAIEHYGTEEQKGRFLPAILGGQIWCQGFSEPDAGSDLANLKTRAERHADVWVVTGQKVWSSYASEADYCILLARTDPDAPQHKGISFFLMPMNLPGVETRPIRQMTGDAEFFEIFLDGVELSDDDLLGAPGQGWEVARYVLLHERGSMFTLLGTVHRDMGALVDLVRSLPPGAPGRRELEARVTRLFVAEEAVQLSNERATEHLAVDRPDPRLEAIMKVSWSELHQEITRTAVEAGGAAALLEGTDPDALDRGRWLIQYLHSRAETIYAGTSEIQRNIIAERVLGLPREARG